MSWPSSDSAIQTLSQCIATLGTRAFYEHFFELVAQPIGADQCMIFLFQQPAHIHCLLSKNFQHEQYAQPLAKAYTTGGYQADPNLDTLSKLNHGELQIRFLHENRHNMPAAYVRQFYDEPGLGDKVSIMTRDANYQLYINFYRTNTRNSFAQDAVFDDASAARLISALIKRHYELNDALLAEGPLAVLSEREREVCRGILAGKKSELIAHEIGIAASSVITYRKRAYQKLGINSRSALFALCRQD